MTSLGIGPDTHQLKDRQTRCGGRVLGPGQRQTQRCEGKPTVGQRGAAPLGEGAVCPCLCSGFMLSCQPLLPSSYITK